VGFVYFLPAHFVLAMWKHVVVAASFDHAWATTNPVTGLAVVETPPLPDIDGAADFATTLLAEFPNVATATAVGVTAGVGTAVVTDEVGITGTLNVTAPDPAAFYADASSKKVALEEWLSNLVSGVPQANVEFTIPAAPTTAAPVPATAADSAASADSTSTAGTCPATGLCTVPRPAASSPTTCASTACTIDECCAAAPVCAVGVCASAGAALTTQQECAGLTCTTAECCYTPGACPETGLCTAARPAASSPTTCASTTCNIDECCDAAPGDAVSNGPGSIPASGDPVAGVIQTTFVVTLPPGKAEMSTRLSTTSPADLLAGFTAQFSGVGSTANVTGVTVLMADPTATEVVGSFVLAVSDTSAQGIESVVSQNSIRTAISQLVGVYLGDVSTIAITPANPAVPIDTQPQANATVGASVDTTRRLTVTPGSVNAGFTILVPGHRAQGWQKDCSLQKISPGVLPAVDPALNPFTDGGDGEGFQTPTDCGGAAVARAAGTIWSFDQSSTQCTISDKAHLSEATFSADSITQFNDGSDGCGNCPSVLANPTAWPANTSAASHAAFDGGIQPTNLQCWPKNANFDLMPCGSQELEALGTRGWPGTCNNLGDATADATEAACQTGCQADPFCSIWMWATADGGTHVDDSGQALPQCWRGTGNGCWTEATAGGAGVVTAAQRLQHGLVNIIKDELTDHVIKNLQSQFPQNVGVGNVNLNTSDAQRTACRNICHSTLMCNYWQSFFDPSATGMARTDLGCWIENPGVDGAGSRDDEVSTLVPYPLTTDGLRIDDAERNLITGGQFIQHHCQIPTLPTRPSATTTTTTTNVIVATDMAEVPVASGGIMDPWGYIVIAVLVIAAIIGVGVLATGVCSPKSAPKKRAIKPIKVKEAPPPPPLQPVIPLVAHPIMVQPTIQQPLAMTTTMAGQQPYAQAMAQPYGGQQFMQRPY